MGELTLVYHRVVSIDKIRNKESSDTLRQPFWSAVGLWGKIGVLMPDTQRAILDERALIESSVKGDQGAMQVLYRRHSGKIYGLALRLSGSPADPEDSLSGDLKIVKAK